MPSKSARSRQKMASIAGGAQVSNGGGEDSAHSERVNHAELEKWRQEGDNSNSGGSQHNMETSQEQKLLPDMRKAVGALGVAAESVSDATLLRFLRARSHDVQVAAKLYADHVSWRAATVPLGYVPDSEVANELAAKKAFLQLKPGERSVVIVPGALHDVNKRDLEEFKRFAIYAIDKIVASLPPGTEKFTAILDMNNTKLKNMDSKAMISTFDMLQAHYPERLARLFIIHVPYLFWGMWKIVSPFVDKVTRRKIDFVEDKRLQSALLAEIPADMLSPEYGGTGSLVPIDQAEVANWPPTGVLADAQ